MTFWRSTKCVKGHSRGDAFENVHRIKSPPPELVAQQDRATAF